MIIIAQVYGFSYTKGDNSVVVATDSSEAFLRFTKVLEA